MRVFLQSIFGQILFSAYILWRGYQALPPKKSWRIPFVAFFIVEITVFFIGFLLHDYLPDNIFIPLMMACNTWYIASIYITITLIFLEILRLINRQWAWYPMYINLYWDRTKIALLFIVTIGITILMIHGYRNVRDPIVQHVYITIPKEAAGRSDLTAVMISDMHIGEMIRKENVQKIVKLCNEQNPDIIFVVGDIIDYESRFAEKEHIEDDLRQLKAPLGVYAVLGNHEYRANRFAKLRWIEKTGMTLLVDSVVMPDSAFYVIGRDDYINRKKRASLTSLMQQTDATKPIILLDHTPRHLNEIAMNHVDLSLHGHTHYGQIWPYSLLMHLIYECPYGYYRKGDTQLLVSSGAGCAGPPYRIGTHSEIVTLHIHFTKTINL